MVHYQLLIKQNGANFYTVNHVTGEKKNKTKMSIFSIEYTQLVRYFSWYMYMCMDDYRMMFIAYDNIHHI